MMNVREHYLQNLRSKVSTILLFFFASFSLHLSSQERKNDKYCGALEIAIKTDKFSEYIIEYKIDTLYVYDQTKKFLECICTYNKVPVKIIPTDEKYLHQFTRSGKNEVYLINFSKKKENTISFKILKNETNTLYSLKFKLWRRNKFKLLEDFIGEF